MILPRLALAANALAKKHSFLTGVAFATSKGVLADVVSQTALQRDVEYNVDRTLAFGLWNGLYCGGVTYLIYGRLFPLLMPLTLASGARHPLARRFTLAMVAFDNFVATPLLCLPTYYVCMLALESRGASAASSPGAVASRGLERYRSEWKETLGLTWALWIPIHSLTFSVVPVHLRVHWTAACSFATLMCMSVLQGALEARRGRAASASEACAASASDGSLGER